MADDGSVTVGRGAFWVRHAGAIRAYVQGVAAGFGDDPDRMYSGREVELLLRANLDLADARHDHFDDVPTPEDPPDARER